jgi:hypothetical protein
LAIRPRHARCCRERMSRTGPGWLSKMGRLAAQKQPPGNSGFAA